MVEMGGESLEWERLERGKWFHSFGRREMCAWDRERLKICGTNKTLFFWEIEQRVALYFVLPFYPLPQPQELSDSSLCTMIWTMKLIMLPSTFEKWRSVGTSVGCGFDERFRQLAIKTIKWLCACRHVGLSSKLEPASIIGMPPCYWFWVGKVTGLRIHDEYWVIMFG